MYVFIFLCCIILFKHLDTSKSLHDVQAIVAVR